VGERRDARADRDGRWIEGTIFSIISGRWVIFFIPKATKSRGRCFCICTRVKGVFGQKHLDV
jgi:hypothetical protein